MKLSFAQVMALTDESFKKWAVTAFATKLLAEGWTRDQINQVDLRIAHMRKDEMRAKMSGSR